VATNFFFNNFAASQEQQLIENLIVESIKIYGYDLFFIPRKEANYNELYGEDTAAYYDNYYPVEMYIKNVDGFEGDGDFLSKFNLEIRDRVTFTIARRVFTDEIASSEGLTRPREGDLIYFPLNRKVFQIKFVEHESIFYQLGALQTYDLICELFEYSGERFNTSIPELDAMEASFSPILSNFGLLTEDKNTFMLLDEDGFKLVNDAYDIDKIDLVADNDELETEADGFIDFSEIDPFSEGRV
jgi:hypothetical protein